MPCPPRSPRPLAGFQGAAPLGIRILHPLWTPADDRSRLRPAGPFPRRDLRQAMVAGDAQALVAVPPGRPAGQAVAGDQAARGAAGGAHGRHRRHGAVPQGARPLRRHLRRLEGRNHRARLPLVGRAGRDRLRRIQGPCDRRTPVREIARHPPPGDAVGAPVAAEDRRARHVFPQGADRRQPGLGLARPAQDRLQAVRLDQDPGRIRLLPRRGRADRRHRALSDPRDRPPRRLPVPRSER